VPDSDLLRIYDFTQLLVASSRSPRQRERMARAARMPVTGASLTALRLIERHGPIVVTELARRLEVDQSTVSRQIRPLEELGLVQRTTDPTDRRVARLAIAGKGRKLLDRARDVVLNDFDVAMSDWSEKDRKRLAELLERFRVGLLEAQIDDSGWAVARTSNGATARR
jgi:DNA-binding MarR family transcriptional regulator